MGGGQQPPQTLVGSKILSAQSSRVATDSAALTVLERERLSLSLSNCHRNNSLFNSTPSVRRQVPKARQQNLSCNKSCDRFRISSTNNSFPHVSDYLSKVLNFPCLSLKIPAEGLCSSTSSEASSLAIGFDAGSAASRFEACCYSSPT